MMPRKKPLDEMEPYSAENALFPDTTGTEDFPLTESLAPDADAPVAQPRGHAGGVCRNLLRRPPGGGIGPHQHGGGGEHP